MVVRQMLAVVVLIVSFAFASAAPAMAQRVALIFGNGAYQGIGALLNPPHDASDVGAKLTELGFKVTLVVDADIGEMRAALATFVEEARGAEVALIFYSGHGLQVDGRNYLIPLDARLRSQGDLETATISDDEIWDNFLEAAPEVAVLVLDACRDNPFASVLESTPGLASGSVSPSVFVQRPNSAGMLIGFAAAPGAVAFDGTTDDGNSPFTTALLQWLDKPGLEVGTMFRRVRGTVLELTRGAQIPWVEEALLRDVFLNPAEPTPPGEPTPGVSDTFVTLLGSLDEPLERQVALEFYNRLTGDQLTFTPANLPPAAGKVTDDRLVSEGLVWLSIRDTKDPDALREFIGRYPDSGFTAIARDRLAELEREGPPAEVGLQFALVDPAQIRPQAAARDDDLPPLTPVAPVADRIAAAPAAAPQAQAAGGPQEVARVGAGAAPSLAQPQAAADATTLQLNPAAGTAEAPDRANVAGAGPAPAAASAAPGRAAPGAGSPDVAAPGGEAQTIVRVDPQTGRPLQLDAAPAEVATLPAAEPAAPQRAGATGPDGLTFSADIPDGAAAPGATVAAPAAPAIDPEAAEAEFALTRDDLRAGQALLAELGFYRGRLDALYGPGTRRAIAALQDDAGLLASGYFDQETLRSLVGRAGRAVMRSGPRGDVRRGVQRLAAMARSGPGAEPELVKVAAQSRNDEVHAYWETLARDFEALYPFARVEFEHQPDWQYKQTLLAMLGSPEPPAILHTWGGGHLRALVDAGFVSDLTDDMAGDWALEFRPGALQNYTLNDRIYGVPTSVELVSLWANGPMLAQAGIDPASLSTWDGFMSAVRTLKAEGVTPLAIGGRDDWTFQLIWGNLAVGAAGREAVEAAVANTDGGFAAAPFVTASERLAELAALDPFQANYLNMNEGEAGNAFARGEAALLITGNWRLNSMGWNWPGLQPRMREELLRLNFPSTAPDGGPQVTYGGANGYALNANAPSIAVEFLRVLTSRDVQSRISELAEDVPSVSGADLNIEDPLVADVAQTLLGSSYHQLYFDQTLGPIAGEVVNEVAKEVATGGLDGEAAAQRIASAWSDFVRTYGVEDGAPATAPTPQRL